jgi:hypothetical protein
MKLKASPSVSVPARSRAARGAVPSGRRSMAPRRPLQLAGESNRTWLSVGVESARPDRSAALEDDMVLKEVGVGSVAKLMGVLYAAIGVVLGLIVACISLLGGMAGVAGSEAANAMPFAGAFGLAAVVGLPVLYGLLGAIGGAIGAALFNLAARLVGGIELRLE